MTWDRRRPPVPIGTRPTRTTIGTRSGGRGRRGRLRVPHATSGRSPPDGPRRGPRAARRPCRSPAVQPWRCEAATTRRGAGTADARSAMADQRWPPPARRRPRAVPAGPSAPPRPHAQAPTALRDRAAGATSSGPRAPPGRGATVIVRHERCRDHRPRSGRQPDRDGAARGRDRANPGWAPAGGGVRRPSPAGRTRPGAGRHDRAHGRPPPRPRRSGRHRGAPLPGAGEASVRHRLPSRFPKRARGSHRRPMRARARSGPGRGRRRPRPAGRGSYQSARKDTARTPGAADRLRSRRGIGPHRPRTPCLDHRRRDPAHACPAPGRPHRMRRPTTAVGAGGAGLLLSAARRHRLPGDGRSRP